MFGAQIIACGGIRAGAPLKLEKPLVGGAFSLESLGGAAAPYTKGRTALARFGQRAAYEIRLEAALAACG